MWLVYVIYSKSKNITYTGSTNNFRARLFQHNNNKVQATKTKGPWIPVYVEFYPDELYARKRERFLKTSSGRRFLQKQIDSIIKIWLGSSAG